MELRDFAERILFATSLEEKLDGPDTITDDRPGTPLVAPASPGRPPELRFRTQESPQADFPGVHRLEQERERGRLLHFFGNHELLATELMALVLLRFPEAPPAFRRGVLNTLQDEQAHTRLYMRRMQECGIAFGELPVSGFFWRCAATMESPIDYVTTLCLTFEQANLDFARHFAQGFQRVGDQETARLLDRIYHDEIGHVAYGLKWFRRWKNPQESDWEAFCRTLKFPLSPQRAKGFTLNVEGRRAAGFDPAFIAELNVYAQSKGRTPNVYLFNPFTEGFLAYGPSFTPVKPQAQLARDLANLPQFLCRQDDLVLVPQRPTVQFLSGIKQAGFALPEFVERKDAQLGAPGDHEPRLRRSGALASAEAGREQPASALSRDAATERRFRESGLSLLAQRKLGALRPWAWGPESVALLAPLFDSVTAEQRTASQRFNEAVARLYSKAWSAAFLRDVLADRRQPRDADHSCGGRAPPRPAAGVASPRHSATGPVDDSWLCAETEAGVAVDTLEAAFEAMAAIRRRGHHRVVAKQALGLAGQSALRLWEPELLAPQRRWLAHALQAGRQLVIEPWLERELDFSVQLEMGPQGLKLCGYTGLLTDRRGQFQGNWAEPPHHRRPPARIAVLIPEPPDIIGRMLRLYEDIFARLEIELRRADFVGPVGIDAFVYREPGGGCRLKPVVEINPRYTMGRVLVELMKQTCPGSCGLFRLVSRSMAQAEAGADFVAYARSLGERFPVQLEGEPVPRIRAGGLCLNDPEQAQASLAVFRVGRTLDGLLPHGGVG